MSQKKPTHLQLVNKISNPCKEYCSIEEVLGPSQSAVIRECARLLQRPYEHINLVAVVKEGIPFSQINQDYSVVCPYLQQYYTTLFCTNSEVIEAYLNRDYCGKQTSENA